MTRDHRPYLDRCLELATEAVEAGDHPFGSVLVAEDGTILHEDRNRANSLDPCHHPEIALARWAGRNLDPDARRRATVYTSGEHCPMCATAHALAGLGPIVYATSSEQLRAWSQELGAAPPAFTPRPIPEVAPDIPVTGPFDAYAEPIRALHARSRR
ncbi:nucleoside deaminase [Roseovarius sp. SCSIO 43702]|uniref:nucleoside deaminase n=1 Tax=Roseovarius sp. SCSIO 43702 TaxID=2823043 RepID=UPI001C729F33|nr:nucleoside deaminase [Roseovarius sp. SCSIO 43702]QYX56912.1 nucleoside deaminase [Roseovarius sp. SCSIO 43702]